MHITACAAAALEAAMRAAGSPADVYFLHRTGSIRASMTLLLSAAADFCVLLRYVTLLIRT